MSRIPSFNSGGVVQSHNTFLVVFKVHGDTIHLWPQDRMQSIGSTHSFKISCHNVETHSDQPGSDIQVFKLTEPAHVREKCVFEPQDTHSECIEPADMLTFITGPVCSTRRTSYAFDVSIYSKHDLEFNEKIGTSYVYLDPGFSTQGVQRTPIIASVNHVPIGQIQVEYLIVTNPIGYGQPSPRPDWLTNSKGLFAGHRGAGSGRRKDLPERPLENTIASFNFAHRNGADLCELDIVCSADGTPVVYHDFDVDAVTAHQSSDELGKFRVQVNEFTLKQLRDFRLLSLHDEEGCLYTLDVPNQSESNKPFPTLAEVLDQVDETCGLNLEVKWPQLLENGKFEARKYMEINSFVESIIDVVTKHARNRRIILESFDADLVIMLRLKQNQFPVIFLSQGMTEHYPRYMDIRARLVSNGIYFAQAFDLAGIDLILDYYMIGGERLVKFIQNHNLIARAWGDLGDGLDRLLLLKDIGVQCITCDRIDQLKKAYLENGAAIERQKQEQEKQHEEQEKTDQEEKENQQFLSTFKFREQLLSYIMQLEPDLAKGNYNFFNKSFMLDQSERVVTASSASVAKTLIA